MHPARKKYLIALGAWWGLCLVGAVALGVVVVLPQENQRAALQKQLDETAERLRHVEAAASPKARARMQAELDALRQRLNAFAVESNSTTALTFQIGQLAEAAQIQGLTSKRKEGLSREKLEGFQALGEVWFDMEFKGNFWQFAQFINQLERHQPVVFVETFELDRNPRGGTLQDATISVCFMVRSEPVAKK